MYGSLAGGGGRDVYVYFDNDTKAEAPGDALRLQERLADVAVRGARDPGR